MIVRVPDLPSEVAVTTALPGVLELASPVAASTVSTAGFELDQATGRVSVVPSLSLSVAVSWRVVMTAIGVVSPPTVTVSTRGRIITASVPNLLTLPVTVLASVLTVLFGMTAHAPETTSKS